jgi:hypothetical protein
MISRGLDLSPGVKVRYRPAHSDVWSEGELVRPSTTGEEWLVKNRFGRFWILVSQLRPADGAPQQH